MINFKSALRVTSAVLAYLLLPEVVVGLVAFVDWVLSISTIPPACGHCFYFWELLLLIMITDVPMAALISFCIFMPIHWVFHRLKIFGALAYAVAGLLSAIAYLFPNIEPDLLVQRIDLGIIFGVLSGLASAISFWFIVVRRA